MNMSRKIRFYSVISTQWFLRSLARLTKNRKHPLHILFCMVDHFEPGQGGVSVQQEKDRMKLLLERFPAITKNHKDSAGNRPNRTWFFPPHYHRYNNLKQLVSLCEDGYGEVELHIHHGKVKPDTPENFESTLLQCIKEYSSFGIFGEEGGRKKYGFIHGDWALDNSRHNKFCGVDNEIEILQKTGCYADFTFPSPNTANPLKINSIYYAQDNPSKPKSHNWGPDVAAKSRDKKGLMMVQGPIHPLFVDNKPWSFRIIGDALDCFTPTSKSRVDAWIRSDISVKDKDDLIVIKVHTHGAEDADTVLGKKMQDIWGYLESQYNDGQKYILHYVTARELYNIIKAVENHEHMDDPEKFRNYRIKPPKYKSDVNIESASDHLKSLVAKTYR